MTSADKSKGATDTQQFATLGHVDGKIVGPSFSSDGKAAEVIVPFNLGHDGWNRAGPLADKIRDIPDHKNIRLNVGIYGTPAAKALVSQGKGGAGKAELLMGARALGGPVTGGRTYLVGEEGPELFTASQSGRIIPNNRLAAAGSPSAAGGFTVRILDWGSGLAYFQSVADGAIADHADLSARAGRAL